jgi:hypothetical protein
VHRLNFSKEFFAAVSSLFASAIFVSAQTNGLPVYDDSLLNGFEERGWAAYSLMNTSPVHAGEYSISVTGTNWQGIAFSRPDFDTTPYASISFWANGGAKGGQRIQIQGLIGGANPPQNVYYRAMLVPNHWQKITVPLSEIGVANKTNLSDIWIQLANDGAIGTFYLDDLKFDAKNIPASVAASAPPVESAKPAPVVATIPAKIENPIAPTKNQTVQTAPQNNPANSAVAANNQNPVVWIIAALGIIIFLLGWLVLVLKRNAAGSQKNSNSAMAVATPPTKSVQKESSESVEEWKQRALLAEAMAGKQGQMLREKIMPELAEFAKQSLVQGLYAQRNTLLDTQQKAQQALAQMESQLASLQLPLQERIRAYEKRIVELEKAVETQGEEMRELTRATLILVRKKLEDEKELGRAPGRFN